MLYNISYFKLYSLMNWNFSILFNFIHIWYNIKDFITRFTYVESLCKLNKQGVLNQIERRKKITNKLNHHPPLIGGIIANSSLSLTIVESIVYSSFRARTMHPCISSKRGNWTRSFFKQSWVVLPDETSNGTSLKPVRSRARAKNRTFIFTKELSFLVWVSSPSQTLTFASVIFISSYRQSSWCNVATLVSTNLRKIQHDNQNLLSLFIHSMLPINQLKQLIYLNQLSSHIKKFEMKTS